MPHAADKIIINGNGNRANHEIIMGNAAGLDLAYESAEFVSCELEINGWLTEPDALAFKTRAEKSCASIHTAQKAYRDAQLAHKDEVDQLTEDMRIWNDKMLLARPKP